MRRLTVASVLALSAAAHAAPLFEAAPGGGPYVFGPNPVSSSGGGTKRVYNDGTLTGQNFAAASRAGLRASARATLTAGDASGEASTSGGPPTGGYAAFTFDDFVVHGPAGAAGFVDGVMHFRLDGTFAADQIAFGRTSGKTLSNSISLEVIGKVLYLDEANRPVAVEFDGDLSLTNVNGDVRILREGVLSDAATNPAASGITVDSPVSSGTLRVPVNRPFTFYLELDPDADVFSDVTAGGDPDNPDKVGVSLDSLSDFGHTLTFASDRPVFDLPAGYTLDSAEAGIVGNVYTVPEPAAGLGALLVALFVPASRRSYRVTSRG